MDINTYLMSHSLLSALVDHLIGNYTDDMWSCSTLKLLEEANDHLGFPKIMWDIDDEPDYSTEVLNEH